MPKYLPVHWLSKEARYRIIDVLLSTRTIKSLATELGITRNAVRKYISRETHPSDEVMEKVFEIIAPYEEERLIKLVIDDIVEALKTLVNGLDEEQYRVYLREKLREVLGKLER
ncbi:MAG: DNA-binding protein [Desulfurococcales archaeon ex4484_58]|nr:MAG: DNA-binding protein [Desulfurococcales archaeon ex4484_58]